MHVKFVLLQRVTKKVFFFFLFLEYAPGISWLPLYNHITFIWALQEKVIFTDQKGSSMSFFSMV